MRCIGNGQQLALLHGWGLPSDVWEGLLPALTKHFQVHLIDLPGYGINQPITSDSLAHTVDQVAAALPDQCLLSAWSLGAQIAMQIAFRYPHKVKQLVLLGASPCFLEKHDWPQGMPTTLLTDFSLELQRNPNKLLSRFVTLINQGDHFASELSRQMKAMTRVKQPSVTVLQQGLDALRTTDLRPLIPEIRQPTLVIHGDKDPLMPLAAAQWLVDHLPKAHIDCFNDSAHTPFLAQPQRFLEALIDFDQGKSP